MTKFETIFAQFSSAGQQLTALGAAEASAGNLSIFTCTLEDFPTEFHLSTRIKLPIPVPPLENGWLIVTASGCRLRDIADSPHSTLCFLHIQPGGKDADLFTATDLLPSSEWNSHLALHSDRVLQQGVQFHAVVHAQPFHLTYLSHIPTYANEISLNQHLLRWQPETILTFPEGIATLPYLTPGSAALMAASAQALRSHSALVWQKHGIVTRSDASLVKAVDLVEYAEIAARYEYANLQAGSPAAGLSHQDLQQICKSRLLHAPILESF